MRAWPRPYACPGQRFESTGLLAPAAAMSHALRCETMPALAPMVSEPLSFSGSAGPFSQSFGMIEEFAIQSHDPGTRWILSPRSALGMDGMRRIFVCLAVAVVAVAALSGLQGNAFALLFALVDLAILGLAFAALRSRCAAREVIALTQNSLRVEGAGQQAEFDPHWVRLGWSGEAPGPRRLLLAGAGKRVEIGRFLAEAERAELEGRLRERIRILVGCDAGTRVA